ncbi:MAG: adenylate/guanylate cyclase domain-containing protein [Fimbriimonadales bacterium]
MSDPVKQSQTSEPLLRFAEYMGQFPEARSRPAIDLAREFDLSEGLVQETLDYLGEIERKAPPKDRTRLFSPRAGIMSLLRLLEQRPLATSAVTSLVFFSMYRYYRTYSAGGSDTLALLLLLFALLAIVAVNFVRGQLRYALYTSAAAIGAGLVAVTLLNLIFGDGTALAWANFSSNLFHALRSTLVFVGFFSLAAVLGAFYRQTRLAAAESSLDRLDLLKKTLNLRERLNMPSDRARNDMRYRSALRWVRNHWKLFAIGIGAFLFCVRIVIGVTIGYPESVPTTVQISAYLLSMLLVLSAYPVVGFVGGSPRNGILAGLLTFATLTLAREFLTPEALAYSARASVDAFPWAGYAFPLAMLMSWVGGAGARVHDQQDKDRMVASSNQAAVVAEIARLSGLLGMARSEVTCMVVDVVQSTRLKREANPLAVEISFREYTSFIRREVTRHGGAVQSIAGDGVVAEFSTPLSAFAAAREIQTAMPEFNNTLNTLNLPFRLRIGLHSGSVHGDLEQVSFAEVIDVAAHIEKRAQPGGIVVTEAVMDSLDDQEFIEIAETVDGQRVFYAQYPTLD